MVLRAGQVTVWCEYPVRVHLLISKVVTPWVGTRHGPKGHASTPQPGPRALVQSPSFPSAENIETVLRHKRPSRRALSARCGLSGLDRPGRNRFIWKIPYSGTYRPCTVVCAEGLSLRLRVRFCADYVGFAPKSRRARQGYETSACVKGCRTPAGDRRVRRFASVGRRRTSLRVGNRGGLRQGVAACSVYGDLTAAGWLSGVANSD